MGGMSDERASVSDDLQGQVDDLRLSLVRTRADIDRLLRRADASEERAEIDRALIAELQAEGLIQQAHAENLEAALRTSRTIGAALGIVMTHRRVDEGDAFQILRRASQDSNTKLHAIADDVVSTGDVSWLPTG